MGLLGSLLRRMLLTEKTADEGDEWNAEEENILKAPKDQRPRLREALRLKRQARNQRESYERRLASNPRPNPETDAL